MPIGDPHCPVHGWTPCTCRNFWVGDNKPDLLYRPEQRIHVPPNHYYLPVDEEEVNRSDDVFTFCTYRFREHTRWSRMIMCIEELWEMSPGVLEVVKQKLEMGSNYSSNNKLIIPWSTNNTSDNLDGYTWEYSTST